MPNSFDYKKVQEIRNDFRRLHSDLEADLIRQIEDYTADRDEINSTTDGRKILKGWKESARLDELCQGMGRNVFGIILNEQLKDEWEWDDVTERGRTCKVYYRKD